MPRGAEGLQVHRRIRIEDQEVGTGAVLEAAEVDEHEEFLRYLVDQEKGHLRLLSEGQQYLADPESWYFEEEQWGVTG